MSGWSDVCPAVVYIYILTTFTITCVIRREGREKRTRRNVGGVLQCLTIQVLL